MPDLVEPIKFYKKEDLDENGLLKPIIFDEAPKGFEEKLYLVLYTYGNEDHSSENGWKLCTGRTETYEFIKSIIDEIDIFNSKILVETKKQDIKTGERGYYFLSIEKSLTVYAFCKSIEQYYGDDGFDIEDYNYSKPEINSQLTPQQQMELNNSESMKIWNMLISGEVKSPDMTEDFDPNDEKYNI